MVVSPHSGVHFSPTVIADYETEVSYVPCYIRPSGEPEALTSAHERFDDVAAYVEEITAAVGFDTHFVRRTDDVLIEV